MNHGIFLRCHTCILEEETLEKSGKRKQDPLPKYVLVVDTETTTDALQTLNFGVYQFCELTTEGKYRCLAWIIHSVSSQKRKDALKGMMNTGFAHPAFPFGASIA